jgi:hypothetical protein
VHPCSELQFVSLYKPALHVPCLPSIPCDRARRSEQGLVRNTHALHPPPARGRSTTEPNCPVPCSNSHCINPPKTHSTPHPPHTPSKSSLPLPPAVSIQRRPHIPPTPNPPTRPTSRTCRGLSPCIQLPHTPSTRTQSPTVAGTLQQGHGSLLGLRPGHQAT